MFFHTDQEIMYKRVSYIVKPWYDDHFDLPTERLRLGKTLVMLTKGAKTDDPVSHGLHLIGWALYEKLDIMLNLLKSWIDDTSAPKPVLHSSEVWFYINYL